MQNPYEESHENIDELVAMSEQGEVKSPLIWTSEDPLVAYSFGHPETPGDILLFFKPKANRLVLRSQDQFGFTESQDELLLDAINKKKLFMLESTPDDAVHGVTPLEETLVGPYIEAKEIIAIISIPKTARPEFTQILSMFHPEPNED